jgi:hypothetical protein
VLSGTETTSILNRRGRQAAGPILRLERWEDVQNRLVLQPSVLGGNLGLITYARRPCALHKLEMDLAYPERTMAGCGRHLLFQVINPTPTVRLRLDVTATFQADGNSLLPPAAAIGQGRAPLPLIGRGSARVFSPPLAPQRVDDLTCVAVDMGTDGTRFPERRTGLMTLFGRKILRDRRLLVAFLRDISLVSEEEYARLHPPERVERFPEDLLHPDLEYSGLFEDGWVSEGAFVCLGRPGLPARLVVRGQTAGRWPRG